MSHTPESLSNTKKFKFFMKIQPKQIKVRDLYDGYKDSGDAGVVGYRGQLNIRPAYQREFVYKDAQRDKVIDTVRKGYPLNVMYWVRNPDPTHPLNDDLASFEVLDGQQRTLSICKYLAGDFSINLQYFRGLPQDQQEAILDYELTVYVCEGPDSEKLEWFKTINIAGEKLTDQELLNAVYTGPWLTSAKAYFSKSNCPASGLASDYMTGSPIRQDYLETALTWISKGNPAAYMAAHQFDKTAIDLWNYFSSVINWVEATFPTARKEMKAIPWGELYDTYKGEDLDPVALEARIVALMQDEDVTRKAGVYTYVLDGNPKHLSLRAFTPNTKTEAYNRQKGLCAAPSCSKPGHKFTLAEMEADHIVAWHAGGKTVAANCQMLCKACNQKKGGALFLPPTP